MRDNKNTINNSINLIYRVLQVNYSLCAKNLFESLTFILVILLGRCHEDR